MPMFCGIDPGSTGGVGIIDAAGHFIAAHRWNSRQPENLFNLLSSIRPEIVSYIYLELVQTFPQLDTGFQNQNQGLLVNMGIWQGFCIAAGLAWEPISPLSWQAAHGLTSWQKKGLPGPLALARQLWPAAPLEFQADDGKAVGLLLAALARLDHLQGKDRRALRLVREEKEKVKKRRRREAKKAGLDPAPAPALAARGGPGFIETPFTLPGGHAASLLHQDGRLRTSQGNILKPHKYKEFDPCPK